ncbi:MAG TPA: SusC/RagA family TonB-linked outer membrane protein, partial [Bacteroidales bacterium]|nr:SusC/RagA family TonB-linked outer membrane protein [Bacteroidales bacterium]
GIFQSYDEVLASPTQTVVKDAVTGAIIPGKSTYAGDIKFKDLNNDGVINDKDRTFIGNYLPDFSYGLNFSASYKNFDISMLIQGTYGNDIYNGTKVLTQGMMRLFNQDKAVLNAWTPTNTSTEIPRAVDGDPNKNSRTSDRFVEDGSYMRIKNLTLGYTLNNNAMPAFLKNAVSSVRIYVIAQNLLTLTGYSGYDPEVAAFGGNNGNLTNGVDFGQIPQPRTFIFGVRLSF